MLTTQEIMSLDRFGFSGTALKNCRSYYIETAEPDSNEWPLLLSDQLHPGTINISTSGLDMAEVS